MNSLTVYPTQPSNSILQLQLQYTDVEDDNTEDIDFDSEPVLKPLGKFYCVHNCHTFSMKARYTFSK